MACESVDNNNCLFRLSLSWRVTWKVVNVVKVLKCKLTYKAGTISEIPKRRQDSLGNS